MNPHHPNHAGQATEEEQSQLHVVFTAANQRCAIAHDKVEQMVTLPPVVPVPHTHPAVAGIINLRGAVIGLLDLRAVFGRPSVADEIQGLLMELDDYEREHQDMVAQLSWALESKSALPRLPEPHECGYGRRYADGAQGNQHVQSVISRIDGPHKALHALRGDLERLVRAGDRERAARRLADAQAGDLARMGQLFNELRETYRTGRRDIALVVRLDGMSPMAVQVDSVETVDTLTRANGTEWDGSRNFGSSMIDHIATDREGRLVTVIEPARLFELVAA
ncbi:MAG: chemotaxis protein CheW [Myxococcales bacterium]|nr:chemotaxis protein CheW [Myxococcales bacterium]MCB9731652.1 chemotaxis protein CheW [Deltaproteobacteria bacterium]